MCQVSTAKILFMEISCTEIPALVNDEHLFLFNGKSMMIHLFEPMSNESTKPIFDF